MVLERQFGRPSQVSRRRKVNIEGYFPDEILICPVTWIRKWFSSVDGMRPGQFQTFGNGTARVGRSQSEGEEIYRRGGQPS